MKTALDLLYVQNIAFIIVSPFSPFDCEMARTAVIVSYDSAKLMTQHYFEAIQNVKGSDWVLHMCGL